MKTKRKHSACFLPNPTKTRQLFSLLESTCAGAIFAVLISFSVNYSLFLLTTYPPYASGLGVLLLGVGGLILWQTGALWLEVKAFGRREIADRCSFKWNRRKEKGGLKMEGMEADWSEDREHEDTDEDLGNEGEELGGGDVTSLSHCVLLCVVSAFLVSCGLLLCLALESNFAIRMSPASRIAVYASVAISLCFSIVFLVVDLSTRAANLCRQQKAKPLAEHPMYARLLAVSACISGIYFGYVFGCLLFYFLHLSFMNFCLLPAFKCVIFSLLFSNLTLQPEKKNKDNQHLSHVCLLFHLMLVGIAFLLH